MKAMNQHFSRGSQFKQTLFRVFLASGLSITAASVAFAQSGEGGNGCVSGGLCNPLKSTSINDFLMKILDVLLTFAVPVIIFFIMYGGFKLVTARGDTGKIEEGRTAITWAVIGGVIILGARLIIGVIEGTVNAL
jgi:hypothetical protein